MATMTAAGRPFAKSFNTLGREAMGGAWPGSDAIVAELAKALASTSISGFGDATPLRLEVLDATMVDVLNRMEHLRIFNAISRVPSPQQIYQWNRRLDHGSTRGQLGFTEGGAPKGGVARWLRDSAQVMFLGTKRGITHQLMTMGTMGGTQVDPVAEENRNGTLALLESLERNIFHGNALILDNDGNTVNYNGLLAQMKAKFPAHVHDMRGQPMDFVDLELAAERFTTTGKLLNFGNIKTWATPFVLADLARRKMQSERVMRGTTDPMPAMYGTPMKGYSSNFGDFAFEPSIMLEAVEANKALAAAEAGVSPVVKPATVTGVVAANGASKMAAGTYYYFVASGNDAGETDARASTGQVVTAGDQVTVTIADVAGATRFVLYRGTTSAVADARWIAQIPATSGGGGTVYVDREQSIPGTGYMILADMNPENWCLPQLAPLLKFPQPISGTTMSFLLILYHTLVVKAAERIQVFENIGRLDGVTI